MYTCKECGESYKLTPDKPGFVYLCRECGEESEREARVVASQAEDEDGVGWYVERNPEIRRTLNFYFRPNYSYRGRPVVRFS